jgi:hypothetical protein
MRALTMAFAVVVAACAVGTSRYMWCEQMQEARTGCCCPDAGDHTAVRATCCELRELATLDSSHAQDETPRVYAALPATTVSTLASFDLDAHRSAPLARVLARDGPSERVHARHSVYLI